MADEEKSEKRAGDREYVGNAYRGHEISIDMAKDHNSILETGTDDSPVFKRDPETDTPVKIGPAKPDYDLTDPYSC